jgi:hypothetical protein
MMSAICPVHVYESWYECCAGKGMGSVDKVHEVGAVYFAIKIQEGG